MTLVYLFIYFTNSEIEWNENWTSTGGDEVSRPPRSQSVWPVLLIVKSPTELSDSMVGHTSEFMCLRNVIISQSPSRAVFVLSLLPR